MVLKSALCVFLSCLLNCGCVAPRYTNHQLLIFGKVAPPVAGPDIPAIQKNLSIMPAPKLNLLAVVTGFATTPLKCLGLNGWKDYRLTADAYGTVVQHKVSSDRFLTVDLRLGSLKINGDSVPLLADRFIRLEIYLGKVPVEKRMFAEKDAVIAVRGKFVWDTDGWFEIHPQEASDVRCNPKPDALQQEKDTPKWRIPLQEVERYERQAALDRRR